MIYEFLDQLLIPWPRIEALEALPKNSRSWTVKKIYSLAGFTPVASLNVLAQAT
jgi:hypothetical protein